MQYLLQRDKGQKHLASEAAYRSVQWSWTVHVVGMIFAHVHKLMVPVACGMQHLPQHGTHREHLAMEAAEGSTVMARECG